MSLRDGRTLNRSGNPSMVWTVTDFVHFVRIMPFFKRGEISEDIVVGVSVISIFEHIYISRKLNVAYFGTVSKEIIGIFFKIQSAAHTSSQLKNDCSLIIKENRVKSIFL